MKKKFAAFALLILSVVTVFSGCSVNERYGHRNHHDRYHNGYHDHGYHDHDRGY